MMSGWRGLSVAHVCVAVLLLCLTNPSEENLNINRLISNYYTLDTTVTVTSTALTTENTNIGVCICDLTEIHCDANCCCDNDCVSTSYYSSFTTCETEGANGTYAFICENRDTLMTAHPPSFADMSRNFLDDMICVEISNNPTSGDYFGDPGTVDATVFSVQQTQTNVYLPSDLTLTLTTDTDTRYKVGQVVNGAVLFGGTINAIHQGGMPLPQPGFAGECSNTTYVEFLVPQRPRRCQVQVENFRISCGHGALSVFASAPRLSNLRVGSSQTASTATTGDWITPTIGNVFTRAADGTLAAAAATELTPAFTDGTCLCENMLEEALYTVYTSDSGTIDSVTVDVIYAQVTANSGADCSATTVPVTFQQTYSVQWFDTGKTATEVRFWSGNPGYIVGEPVLAGIAATSPSGAIQPRQGGFMFNFGQGEGGACTGSTVGYYSPIQFGKDHSYGCSNYLNLAGLQTFCSSTINTIFDITDTYIGMWGNSTDYNTADWVTITKNTLTPTVTYSAQDQSCAGVVTGVHLEILTWNFGSWINPQTAIVGAQTRYTTDTLYYPLRDTTSHTFPFPMRATVSFVEFSAQTAEEFTASPSPVLPTFPSDFFYPFLAASPASTASPISVIAVVLLTMIFTVCVL